MSFLNFYKFYADMNIPLSTVVHQQMEQNL